VTVNRRSASRHEVEIAVALRVAGEAPESAREVTIKNLSLGGAYLTMGQRLTIGTAVSLRFRIPTHDHPIEAAAVVRWTDSGGIGVQFDRLRAGEVWSLGKFFEGL
jgi:hypothetical protein